MIESIKIHKMKESVRIRYKYVSLLVLSIMVVMTITSLCLSQVNTQQPKPSNLTPAISKSQVENPINLINIILPLASVILGGISGALISIWFSERRRKQELRSLILAFCSEFVPLFKRCVMYYKQAMQNSISYSALFTFTDASALSKFASVGAKPDVIAGIVELKSMYFQIQRHADEAAKFAIEGSRLSDEVAKQETMRKASDAQEKALAFFLNSYERVVNETIEILKEAQHLCPGATTNRLFDKFNEAKLEKEMLDKSHNQ